MAPVRLDVEMGLRLVFARGTDTTRLFCWGSGVLVVGCTMGALVVMGVSATQTGGSGITTGEAVVRTVGADRCGMGGVSVFAY